MKLVLPMLGSKLVIHGLGSRHLLHLLQLGLLLEPQLSLDLGLLVPQSLLLQHLRLLGLLLHELSILARLRAVLKAHLRGRMRELVLLRCG